MMAQVVVAGSEHFASTSPLPEMQRHCDKVLAPAEADC